MHEPQPNAHSFRHGMKIMFLHPLFAPHRLLVQLFLFHLEVEGKGYAMELDTDNVDMPQVQ